MSGVLSKVILIALLCTSLKSLAQITNGSITYKVNADAFAARVKENREAKKKAKRSKFEIMAEEMHRIEMVLSFEGAKSVFHRTPGLALDNAENAFQMAVAFADRGTYYTDIKEKKLLIYREYLGEVILVDDALKEVDWELTNEKKKLGDFECYKAVSSVETSIGKLPIIAWYAPNIPLAFAPADYGGTLPGLILELHTNEISFICKEINLNSNKNITIAWPNTAVAITQEAYKKMNEDLAKSFRRN